MQYFQIQRNDTWIKFESYKDIHDATQFSSRYGMKAF